LCLFPDLLNVLIEKVVPESAAATLNLSHLGDLSIGMGDSSEMEIAIQAAGGAASGRGGFKSESHSDLPEASELGVHSCGTKFQCLPVPNVLLPVDRPFKSSR
jgi:hypothetical protein